MTKNRKSAQRAEQIPLWPSLSFDPHNPRLQQSAALLVAIIGALLAAAIVGWLHTPPTDALASFLKLLFGIGAVLAALSLVAGGVWALRALIDQQFATPWRRIVGGEVLFFALLALVHMAFSDGRT
ncbi:MAG: hypothetical protein LC737_10805, partial [Chloroflexi bacterium]|nr:hypothetical protein [Chloroflexota bacterium]